jgi:hypothetical protein
MGAGQAVPDIHLAIPPAALGGHRACSCSETTGPRDRKLDHTGTAVSLDLGRDDLKVTAISKTVSPEYSVIDQAPACRPTP